MSGHHLPALSRAVSRAVGGDPLGDLLQERGRNVLKDPRGPPRAAALRPDPIPVVGDQGCNCSNCLAHSGRAKWLSFRSHVRVAAASRRHHSRSPGCRYRSTGEAAPNSSIKAGPFTATDDRIPARMARCRRPPPTPVGWVFDEANPDRGAEQPGEHSAVQRTHPGAKHRLHHHRGIGRDHRSKLSLVLLGRLRFCMRPLSSSHRTGDELPQTPDRPRPPRTGSPPDPTSCRNAVRQAIPDGHPVRTRFQRRRTTRAR